MQFAAIEFARKTSREKREVEAKFGVFDPISQEMENEQEGRKRGAQTIRPTQ